jgi:GNAT superfamily N-acetyltransferase
VSELEFRRYDGSGALAMLDTLTEVYLAGYAGEPDAGDPLYSRQAFTERTTRQAREDGFALLTGSVDGELAGYTFGCPQAPGQWPSGPCDPEPPAGIVQSARFFVVELIVRQPFRGRGYARVLMDGLLAGRPEPFAALTANPDRFPRDMYLRWGWQHVCKLVYTDTVTFDVLVKELVTSD